MSSRDFTEYSQHSDTQAKQSEKLLGMVNKAVREELSSGENINFVLDAGCGDGEVTEDLDRLLTQNIKTKTRIVGIDSSEKRVKNAAKNHKQPNIQYANADITSFSTKTDFDIIFSNAALHWIPSQQKMYQNFYKLLRPKGILAVHQGAEGSYIELHNIAVKTAQELGLNIQERKMPPAYLSPAQAKELLKSNGFQVAELEAVEYPMKSNQIVKDFAEASLSEYFSGLNKREISRFKQKFVENGISYIESSGEVAARRLYFTAFRN